MRKFCAFLTCSLFLAASLAQNSAIAQQATLDAARPQFGSSTTSSTYSASNQTSQSAAPQITTATAAPAGMPGQFNNWQQQQQQQAMMMPGGASSVVAADPDKKFDVGDMVSFSIAEDRDPQPVLKRVTDTGEIDFPYIGRVSVTGKNAAQVTAEVKRKLEAQYYYKATVNIGLEQSAIGRPKGKIYVAGDVKAPGPQEFFPGEKATVSAAIIKAGQFTQFANQRKVQLTRQTKDGRTESTTVDVRAVLNEGHRDRDVDVQDNDYIFVPRRGIVW